MEKRKKRRGRSAYTEEFRREAVRLVEQAPDRIWQIARDLDVHHETLRSWWQRACATGKCAAAVECDAHYPAAGAPSPPETPLRESAARAGTPR